MAQAVEIDIDVREFQRALKLYEKATKKDIPRVLNHAATQAAFKAMTGRYTPQASKSGHLGNAADPALPKKKWNYRNRLYYALAVKNGAQPGERKAKAHGIYARRRSSIGFIRANWGAVVNDLGLKRANKFPRTKDIHVIRATAGRHVATLYNAKLEGKGQGKAIAKLSRGWNAAIHEAVWGRNGMVQYAEGRLKKNWKRR